MKNKTFKTAAIICGFLLLGGCHYVKNSDQTTVEEYGFSDEDTQASAGILSGETIPTDNFIYVQVCGHVVKPGVYKVMNGTRIHEVLELAGGALDDGAPDSLWLARKVQDGERIYVPGAEETEEQAKYADDGLVNINMADEAVLMTLPGIGQAKAADIVAYRRENGAFDTIEDIMRVPGIKEAVFQKIKDKIKTG